MPTFLPPRVGLELSQALAEVYTQRTIGDPMLITLEVYHPGMLDGDGNPTSFRCVNEWTDLLATLEASAPFNPSEEVTFHAVPFRYVSPSENDTGAPAAVSIEIDNASLEVTRLLDSIIGSPIPVIVIERRYLPSDTSAPHATPTVMELQAPEATTGGVRMSASFGNLTNRRFPGLRYTRAKYPALAAK